MAHDCNPSTGKSRGKEDCEFKTSLSYKVRSVSKHPPNQLTIKLIIRY